MIDLQTVKDVYQSFEVNEVADIRLEYNIDDKLKKEKNTSASLGTV